MPDMLVKLYDLPDVQSIIQRLKDQGVVVRTARAWEKHQVVEWVRETFGAAWASGCDVSFSNRPISSFIATREGKIMGFACHDSTCRNFFGPIGVTEQEKGHGIGKALLLSCLHAMSAAGYAYAVIGSAGDSATGFYARVAGATEIEGSSPGIYRDQLKGEER